MVELTSSLSEGLLPRSLLPSSQRHIERDILAIYEALKHSVDKKRLIFNYSSEEELCKAQLLLLEIGFNLLMYLEDKRISLNELCFKTLCQLFHR